MALALIRSGVFFFKQKTAYEVRISDWSSDVCSSDLPGERVTAAQAAPSPRAVMVEKALRNRPDMKAQFVDQDLANNDLRVDVLRRMAGTDEALETAVKARREAAGAFANDRLQPGPENMRRSDERRVG